MRHLLAFLFLAVGCAAAPAPLPFQPDLVVAADGSGDFKTIHEAVQSVPKDNHERRVIFVKNALYTERVRVDAACITLRGESRAGTRIEFSRSNTAPRDQSPIRNGKGRVDSHPKFPFRPLPFRAPSAQHQPNPPPSQNRLICG